MSPKGPKRLQEPPKTTPRGGQEGQKSEPEPQDDKRTKPSRSHDRLWPPKGPKRPNLLTSQGRIWEAKTAPKPIPKRTKIETKIEEEQKNDPRRSWTRLRTILGRSWPHLGINCGNFLSENVLFRENHFFDDKTVRRRFRDQLRWTKTPKGPETTPKRDPRSSPKLVRHGGPKPEENRTSIYQCLFHSFPEPLKTYKNLWETLIKQLVKTPRKIKNINFIKIFNLYTPPYKLAPIMRIPMRLCQTPSGVGSTASQQRQRLPAGALGIGCSATGILPPWKPWFWGKVYCRNALVKVSLCT